MLCRVCCAVGHHGHETVTTVQLAEDIESALFDKSFSEKTDVVSKAVKQRKTVCAASLNRIRTEINQMLDEAE